MPVRGLTIVVTRPDGLCAALELAAANAALGGAARVFCQGEAVAALALPMRVQQDSAHTAAGLPTLAELFGEALALGVTLLACQSGLTLAGLDANMIDPRVEFGGPVGMLQGLGDDRLLSV